MQNITYQLIEELETSLLQSKRDFLIQHGWAKAIELLEDWMWEKVIEGRIERLPLDMAVKYESILQEMRNGKSSNKT